MLSGLIDSGRKALVVDEVRALPRIVRTFVKPRLAVRRFVRAYPVACPLRTPLGVVAPTLYSHHDLWTVKQVFIRVDYPVPTGAKVVVDLGSNIGITALRYLTRTPDTRCHLYEPDPRNVERLRLNLAGFEPRYSLTEAAVADRSGTARFGRETSGRYGAIGLDCPDVIDVPCFHINEVLRSVVEREGRIDILKIDIEGVENQTVAAIDPGLLARLGAVYFETLEPFNPAPELFSMSYAHTCRLVRLRGPDRRRQPDYRPARASRA
jgi:FkbM family methyltransferase